MTTIGLFVVLLILQYRVWVGEGSFAQVHNLRFQITQQAEVNEQLAVRNERIELDIVGLKGGLDAIEEKARNELGMIKPGETFYVFVEP